MQTPNTISGGFNFLIVNSSALYTSFQEWASFDDGMIRAADTLARDQADAINFGSPHPVTVFWSAHDTPGAVHQLTFSEVISYAREVESNRRADAARS